MHRTFPILALSALILTGCATTGDTAAGEPKNPQVLAASTDTTPINAKTAVLTVYGMSCPLCANNVDNSLTSIPGVIDSKIDMGSGRVTVTMDGIVAVTPSQLVAAIDNSGFSLQAIEIGAK